MWFISSIKLYTNNFINNDEDHTIPFSGGLTFHQYLSQQIVNLILSDTEIAIFNNNNLNTAYGEKNYQTSEIIIYNLENENFSKLYQQSLDDSNFYTETNGSFDILKNGLLIAEETNYGRLLMINKKEEIFEYINRSNDDLVYIINWFRVIETKNDVEEIRNLFKNRINKC